MESATQKDAVMFSNRVSALLAIANYKAQSAAVADFYDALALTMKVNDALEIGCNANEIHEIADEIQRRNNLPTIS